MHVNGRLAKLTPGYIPMKDNYGTDSWYGEALPSALTLVFLTRPGSCR